MRKNILFIISLLLLSISSFSQNEALEKAIDSVIKDKHNFEKILEVERLLPSSKNTATSIKARCLLGVVYNDLEVYDKAYSFYLDALKIAEDNGLIDDLGDIQEDLGNIQSRLENYDEALKFYKEAKINFERINDFGGVVNSKGNIAIVDIKTGHKERAINLLLEIKELKNIDIQTRATTLLTIANVYLESGEVNKAIDYYYESLSLIEGSKRNRFKILLYQNLAESYIALKQYDKAFTYNKKSEDLLEEIDSNELKSSLHFFYSEIHKGKGKYKEAFESLKKHQEFEALLDDLEYVLKIKNVETINEIRKHRLDLKINQQKIELLENEKFLFNIKVLFVVLALIALLVLAFYLLKKQRRKVETLHTEIVQTNDKLEFSQTKTDKMVLNLTKNIDFLEHFREDLKSLQSKIEDSEHKSELNKLIINLQNFKLINDTKEDLFNQVDIEFVYKLERNFPDLTEEERRVCVLIYLNLKNKNIAVLLNLSVRSVENHRYRIRKKLNLESSNSLSLFLQSM
ncbi:LuxR family transcriptional regulator [uncultured Flavobacterium sp.]|uniref:tetratricopeptide repeat protein n=1 Tax=uncultured Flavobacterium sp. TaxID=165435 RepID=UPI0025FDA3D3|nr:LuxR family transcriptional regulator [uncultured Flavobacterium sp.]